ncbi:MAG: ComF family protein [Flammeovirgaceae bacterium]|nr:MAG: ComF family protein [Flammeovirgaceae bacterium]
MQELLHELKYNNRPEIGQTLGRVYGNELAQAGYDRQLDVIIPIPLHEWKRKRRGYNQSEEFAIGLAAALNVAVETTVVKRAVNTETQTRKSRLKRWENVSEVFVVANPRAIEGKRVLIADDVITTGATIEACGSVLLQAGCATLSAVSVAYAGE